MEYVSNNRLLRTFVLVTAIAMFLIACTSTSVEDTEPECRSSDTENCSAESDTGDERGYNPCLINKNLPVCKK